MPIIETSVLEARRAAVAARPEKAAAPTAPNDPAPQVPPAVTAPVSDAKPKRRGHAVKDENDKWLPTGDYPEGWCRPPVKNQFQKNGKGGPGRPKKSMSHDTLMKKHLSEPRKVRVDGKEKKIATRELVVMTTVKAAAEGKDRDARKFILAEMARIWGEEKIGTSASSELNAADLLSLTEYEAELRRQIREELLLELRAAKGDEE